MLLALTLCFAAAAPSLPDRPDASLPGALQEPPHVVFVTGDEEYRSEESMPMLASILEHQYGFRTTILYAQDEQGHIAPNDLDNIPGLEVLAEADLMVHFTRFRALPDEQLQHILDYAQSGRPMVGFRTTTHAFLYPEGSPHREWNDDYGREFFGQKWITHHGHRSTTAVSLAEEQREHPVLRGVEPFTAPSWLYHVSGGGDALPDDAVPLLHGEALNSSHGEERAHRFPLRQPLAWTRQRDNGQRVFFTTLGHPGDFTWASMRRLSVNGILWALGREEEIPEGGAETYTRRPFQPTADAYGGAIPGRLADGLPIAWTPRPNANIALVGNTMAERMGLYGNFETMLQLAYPEAGLTVRNLGWSADTPTWRPRPAKYDPLEKQLEDLNVDTVFAFFGFNESFGGFEGQEKFRDELEDFVRLVRSRRLADGSYPELVFVTPIFPEQHGGRSFDAPALAGRIQPYVDILRETAWRCQARFLHVFEALGDSPGEVAPAGRRNTINGIHLNARGDKAVAEAMLSGLHGPWVEVDARYLAVREAVQEKDRQWFYRYRAINGAYIYGGRKDPFGSVSFPQEMHNLDLLCAAHDLRIRALATAGDFDSVGAVDPGGLPPLPDIVSNYTKDITILSPEEAEQALTVAEGYRAEVFADDTDFPLLQNPVALTFDGKGRLWVATMPTYPQVVPGTRPDCKLLILEDTDGDRRADKQTVFADGLYLPTGFELGDGGAYVGQQPNLVFLQDTDGDDVADRREIVLHGFGTEDSHHSISAFTWGPGGGLYMQEGTFHHSQVETPYGPVRLVDGGVFRYEPHTGRLRVHTPFGFWNPWGHVFDDWGQDYIGDASDGANYLAAPMATDKEYSRYRRGLPSFTTATVRPTGGSELVTGHLFPQSVQGDYLVTNTIGFQGIRGHRLREDGSGVMADEHWDLLTSSDPNFRPIDLQFGPDGALYFVDWFNPLIGHMQHSLRDPNRDHEHGRIWRVSYIGDETAPAMSEAAAALESTDLSGLGPRQLVALLDDSDARLRYRVRRELRGHMADRVEAALAAHTPTDPRTLLEHLWVRQQQGILGYQQVMEAYRHADPRVRAAVVRAMNLERGNGTLLEARKEVLLLAAKDAHPRVRLEAVAFATRFPEYLGIEAVLDVAQQPTDRWLDYAIDQAIRFLRPQWTAHLTSGWWYADRYPEAILPLLGSVDTPTLMGFAWNEEIAKYVLLRRDAPSAVRYEAIAAARGEARDSSDHAGRLAHWLDLLEEIDASTAEEDLDLAPVALHFPTEALVGGELPLKALALNARRADVRLAAMVGWMQALEDGKPAPLLHHDGPDELWRQCSLDPDAMTTALEAARLLGPKGAALRANYLTGLLNSPTTWPGCPTEDEAHASGRFLRVELEKGPLTLAEVEVWSGGVNVARTGVASQDSVAWGGAASRAIDGDPDGAWGSGTSTHTMEGGNSPWWEVDLGDTLSVEEVRLWNRTDPGLGERLDGYTLRLLDANRQVVWESADQPAPKTSVAHTLKVQWPDRIAIACLRALAAGEALPTNPVFADIVLRRLESAGIQQRDLAWFRDGLKLLERLGRHEQADALRVQSWRIHFRPDALDSEPGKFEVRAGTAVALEVRNGSGRWQAPSLLATRHHPLLQADEPQARFAASEQLQRGYAVYQKHCLSCHGTEGEGLVGPNMSDDHFLHLERADQMLALVRDGMIEKGMTPFEGVLDEQEMTDVVALMQALRGTWPSPQKEAQGKLIDPWEAPADRMLRIKREAGMAQLEILDHLGGRLLAPGLTTTLYFDAPQVPGDYLLVSAMPGNAEATVQIKVTP